MFTCKCIGGQYKQYTLTRFAIESFKGYQIAGHWDTKWNLVKCHTNSVHYPFIIYPLALSTWPTLYEFDTYMQLNSDTSCLLCVNIDEAVQNVGGWR